MSKKRIFSITKKAGIHILAVIFIIAGIIIFFIPFIPGTPFILIGLVLLMKNTENIQDRIEKTKFYINNKTKIDWLNSKI